VLLDFQQPHNSKYVKSMQDEARHLLAPSGIDIDVKLRSEMPASAEFKDVLVFKMTGSCGTSAPDPMMFDERSPLAEAYVVDGKVLSFGEIHCEQIKSAIDHSPRGRLALGTALGRVLAHETYHMLGQTKGHTKSGVTKKSLSPMELSELGPFPPVQ